MSIQSKVARLRSSICLEAPRVNLAWICGRDRPNRAEPECEDLT